MRNRKGTNLHLLLLLFFILKKQNRKTDLFIVVILDGVTTFLSFTPFNRIYVGACAITLTVTNSSSVVRL